MVQFMSRVLTFVLSLLFAISLTASVASATVQLRSRRFVLEEVLLRVRVIVSLLPSGNYLLELLLDRFQGESEDGIEGDYDSSDWIECATYQIASGLTKIPRVGRFEITPRLLERRLNYNFTRFKIADGESGRPRGRVFIQMNYFNEVATPSFSETSRN